MPSLHWGCGEARAGIARLAPDVTTHHVKPPTCRTHLLRDRNMLRDHPATAAA
jgi:hypothetical protein